MPGPEKTERRLETLEGVERRECRAALGRAAGSWDGEQAEHTEEPENGLELSERM